MTTASTDATSRDGRRARRAASTERVAAAASDEQQQPSPQQQQKQPAVTVLTGGGVEVTLDSTEIRGATGNTPLGSMFASTASLRHESGNNAVIAAGTNEPASSGNAPASRGNVQTGGSSTRTSSEQMPSGGSRDVTSGGGGDMSPATNTGANIDLTGDGGNHGIATQGVHRPVPHERHEEQVVTATR
ncbi:hypothetical protein PHYPSEUDO_002454 [Phytophthora pseudosyringae]|uniref:Uncharacterized protein n=1 Tax=Phytophthora pseudosyringae TaxID=221518 RepID=A0A8T1V4K1_9STRA|nr:hypothetical protein PHYPSEUDO_002454 [Phytophthora pseudosyringae]